MWPNHSLGLVVAGPTAELGSALRLHAATSHLPVRDIVETRMVLESWAASSWLSRLRAEHRGILAAVASHDGGRAARVVADPIEGFYAESGRGSGGLIRG